MGNTSGHILVYKQTCMHTHVQKDWGPLGIQTHFVHAHTQVERCKKGLGYTRGQRYTSIKAHMHIHTYKKGLAAPGNTDTVANMYTHMYKGIGVYLGTYTHIMHKCMYKKGTKGLGHTM